MNGLPAPNPEQMRWLVKQGDRWQAGGMSTTLFGILLGLAAATCQSVTYLQSRHFVGHAAGGRRRLMLLGHVIQGGIGLTVLPLLWPAEMPAFRQYVFPLLMSAGGFLVGQAFLFGTLRHVEASRVAPFLSIKIPLLAILAWLVMGRTITGWQWTAVGLAMAGAWLLNWTGGQFPTRMLVTILLTCAGYAVSDLFIRALIESLAPVPPLRAALVGVALSYIVCGVAVLPVWFSVGKIAWSDVQRATPYALTWLASMVFLYACFALINVVLGNIVQSTRGLISILLAPVMARSDDWGHLETTQSPHAILRRAAVALLMTAAVALYVWGA